MSYADEEEEYNAEYGHSHMAIAISENNSELRNNVGQRFILKVYIPASFYQTVVKARMIAKREGRSLSDLIRELLRDYVRRHEPGNPQLPLSRFIEKSEDSRRCSVEGCDELAAYQVFLDRGRVIEKMHVCEEHLMDLRRGWLGGRRVDYKSLSWRRISRR
ncbi:MAG: hypothetical protein DRO36_06790 [Candidatus Hecatellales archaeon]|nr:MAG: hypothetical protein DRO36_06790 [Candidatus Hecatellales archaeon]